MAHFWLVCNNSGISLMQAWSPCPNDVQGNHSCLNTTDWRIFVPFNVKLTITSRRASTVFDRFYFHSYDLSNSRFNFTILDVIDYSDPVPTNYTAADFFIFYESIFNVDSTQPNYGASVEYMFLIGIHSYLTETADTQNGTGSDDRLLRLQDFLATPIILFNNAVYGGDNPDMGKSATLASPSYRVTSSLIGLIN